jgi:hypothetical protein
VPSWLPWCCGTKIQVGRLQAQLPITDFQQIFLTICFAYFLFLFLRLFLVDRSLASASAAWSHRQLYPCWLHFGYCIAVGTTVQQIQYIYCIGIYIVLYLYSDTKWLGIFVFYWAPNTIQYIPKKCIDHTNLQDITIQERNTLFQKYTVLYCVNAELQSWPSIFTFRGSLASHLAPRVGSVFGCGNVNWSHIRDLPPRLEML